MTVLLVLFTLILFLVFDHFVQRFRLRPLKSVQESMERGKFSMHTSFDFPGDVSLATNHMWLRNNLDGTVTVGVDEFLSRLVGALEEISLPRSGDPVVPATADIGVRSQRRVLRLATPLTGDVVASNVEVLQNPSLVLSDPYGKGWLMRVRPNAHAAEKVGDFLVGRPVEWIKEQIALVRDFLATSSQHGQSLVLQEGGLPLEGVLQQFDEDVWKNFGHSFASLHKIKNTNPVEAGL